MFIRKSGIRGLVAGGLCCALLLFHAASADAQEKAGPAPGPAPGAAVPPPVIGVVDVDQILQESAAAKSVRSQADKYQQTFQQEISKEEATLRATQQELEAEQQHRTLTQEAFAEKARAFEASAADFQRKGMARRRAFDKSVSAAMGQVQKAMLEASQQVAQAHGVTVLLPRNQVLLFDDKMNITKEIVAVMDKKLTHVDFPPPKVEAEMAPGAQGGNTKKKP